MTKYHPSSIFSRLAAAVVMALTLQLSPYVHARVLPFNEQKVPQTKEDLMAIQKALVDNLERVRKATVSISLGQGFGSGVIVSADGLILTAAHVTAGVDKELTVILNDGTKLKAVSMGLVSNTDAAMMRITEEGEYPFVDINKDNDYKLGHWIFALGHSGGFDKERGPVVRLGRIVKDSETTLQSDCKVIGGDSGGPLFDMEGRLIGIHSRVSKTMEQNMHVPMREYLKHWDEMKQNQFLGDGPFAKRPVKGTGFLGFGSTYTDDGLVVGKVLKDGPADKAGIKAGDIVLKVDGKNIPDKDTFQAILKEKSEGDKVVLLIRRKGEEQTIELKLGKK
ncbi:MAG: serine protease [Akkermansiaceae bacterium]|nr:serine protease [Akkermansiaceae bacterium]